MDAPQSEWDRIMHQPVNSLAAPKKIAGLNDKGELVLDQHFVDQNCDEIVQGVKLHEETHKRFFYSNPGQVIMGELLRVRAESEVESYRAEKEFLYRKIKDIDKDCKQ